MNGDLEHIGRVSDTCCVLVFEIAAAVHSLFSGASCQGVREVQG